LPLLRTEDLVVEKSTPGLRHPIPLLKNISIDLEENRVTGLIGESGAGKTILAKTLAALLPPQLAVTGGTFHYKEQRITCDTLKKMRGRQIFYTPQNAAAALNPVLRIKHQVNETAKTDSARWIEIFKNLGFPDPERVLNAYPFELSGGESQRCLLAMALARNPRLLILDEPFASLDLHLREGFMQLIKQVQHRCRLTILLITHNLAMASSMADYIYILLDGEILEAGETRELFSRPAHHYTREIVKILSDTAL
jgi:ABC-type dipeptide/oligopeptide/nickel transport system ATPase component